jgi:putative ABC transport system permease protein
MIDRGHITDPPHWGTQFLSWFCKTEYLEDILGDLTEEYHGKEKSSVLKAKFWFNWQVIKLFRPSMCKKLNIQNSIEKESTMFRNYLKIGFRNVLKYKSSSLINVLGLSTGLAAFILIALFIKDEFSYDRHHEHADHVFRVTVKNYDNEGLVSRQWAFASAGHAERLKEDYASITHATRFFPWAFPDLKYGEQLFPSEQVVFTDEDVFDIFTFEFIQGDPQSALTDIYSLVLTETSAIKLFGNDWAQQSIIGETIQLSRDGQGAPFKVTAIIEDMPDQQHFHFEYLAPIRFVSMIMGEETMNNVGGNYNWLTYFRIAPGTNIDALQSQSNDEFWDKYIGSFPNGAKAKNYYDFEFQPLKDIHLQSNLEGEIEPPGSIQQVYIFGAVGILILLVACINYMNLSTSHYSRRMKEVGVRKVIGAMRGTLVRQFLVESTLIVVISLPIAIGLVYWSLPFLNDFMDKSLTLNFLNDTEILVGTLLLLIIVGLVSGLYPALFLSRVQLVHALKGEQAMNARKWNFRSVLVTFQYAVTIALIFSILVIEGQLSFIRNQDPGYEKDQIVHLFMSRNINNQEVFKQEILNHPNIVEAAYATRVPTGRLGDSWGAAFYRGDSLVPASFRLPCVSVDEDYLTTFDIALIAGENFTRDQHMQRDSTGYYIINEAAARAFGYDDPSQIVGMQLAYGPFDGSVREDGSILKMGRIQGVVKDFHFESLHSKIVPMVMMKNGFNFRNLNIKVKATNLKETLGHIEETWASFDPVNPVEYRFLDDMFNDQYQQEERLSTMISTFTILAILISCLGLIGMVGFIIETKLKEIGVRKVLGASVISIWVIISSRFMILMGIGFVLSLPLAYWLMDGWLTSFVYRINIGLLIIVIPIVTAAVLTLLAISFQTYRAGMVNPVDCLKDE